MFWKQTRLGPTICMRSILLVGILSSCNGFSHIVHTIRDISKPASSALPCHLNTLRYTSSHRGQRKAQAHLIRLSAGGADPLSITSGLVAFGHYSSFLGAFGCLTAEKLLLKKDLSVKEAANLGLVDAGYGVVGLVILGTGYLRLIQYAKGWEFYAHSPFFYGKMLTLGLVTALSLYPTITFVKWSIAAQGMEDKTAPFPSVNDATIKRLQSCIKHELYLFICIPLFAALMARGIGYTDTFPMWVMAAGAIVPTVGACGVAVKSAVADTNAWDNERSKLE